MTVTQDLAAERFVSLTTYRRAGEGVPTPVWIATVDGTLVVITPAGTGKVGRLRRDDRVELRPCDRRGRVAEDAARHAGSATLVDDRGAVDRIRAAMRAKYGWEFRLFMAIEALLRRGRHVERLGVRIRLTDPA